MCSDVHSSVVEFKSDPESVVCNPTKSKVELGCRANPGLWLWWLGPAHIFYSVWLHIHLMVVTVPWDRDSPRLLPVSCTVDSPWSLQLVHLYLLTPLVVGWGRGAGCCSVNSLLLLLLSRQPKIDLSRFNLLSSRRNADLPSSLYQI